MGIKHVDHVGLVVDDLKAATNFFVDLGFVASSEMQVNGEWVERIIGLKNVSESLIMLTAPDGQLSLELVKFHHPTDPKGVQVSEANTLGLRHIAFQVNDIDTVVNALKQKGHRLVGKIQTYENIWKLCYIRGPEGIIIELAEQLT